MNVADGQSDCEGNEPRDEEWRNPPLRDRHIREDRGRDDDQRDDSDQRLIEDALQQDQREIRVHGRAKHRHHGGLGNESSDRARQRRRHKLDDPGPNDGGGRNSPGEFLIARLQIHGQHDRQRVGNDSRHIVDVHVGCDVGAALALRESHAQRRQTHGADEESQGKSRQKVRHAETHGDADGREQKSGDDHLRHVEADLRDGGVDVSALERPPAQRTRLSAFRHSGLLRRADLRRDAVANLKFEISDLKFHDFKS